MERYSDNTSARDMTANEWVRTTVISLLAARQQPTTGTASELIDLSVDATVKAEQRCCCRSELSVEKVTQWEASQPL